MTKHKTIKGSCLCGGIKFEVSPPFIRANHCHCTRCQKHSGTAMCTQAMVRKDQFKLLSGDHLIRVFGKDKGGIKAFCQECGSNLFGGSWPDGPEVSIRMGAFDEDPGIKPQFHSFVDSKASWDDICDDLKQYPEDWN